MYAKRSSVTRCETRPRLVRNSLRNSSFTMGKIFLRGAPWLFRASVAKGPAGACVELLALLGPTRSVVVEAPLRFLPGRGAKPQRPPDLGRAPGRSVYASRRAMVRTCSRGHRFPCRPLFHSSSKVPPADILSLCAKSALLPPEKSSVAKSSPRKI